MIKVFIVITVADGGGGTVAAADAVAEPETKLFTQTSPYDPSRNVLRT